jgi:hypothetical protein
MYIWSHNLIPLVCLHDEQRENFTFPINSKCLHDEQRENFTFPLNYKLTCGNMHVSHCTPLRKKQRIRVGEIQDTAEGI